MNRLKFLIYFIGILLTGGWLYHIKNAPYYIGPLSNHFDGALFFNPDPNPNEPTKKRLFGWLLQKKEDTWPSKVSIHPAIPVKKVFGNELKVTFVNHATVLIQTQGLNILTDPIWAERASPLPFMGPKRVHDPGITFNTLPPIDIVLISHNHSDHLDFETIYKIYERDHPKIYCGLGVDEQIKQYFPHIHAEGLDWEYIAPITPELSVVFVPAHHWSSRELNDRNKTLWGGFVLKVPAGNIYFSGDTGFNNGKHFEAIKEKFAPLRLSLLPIGAYLPRDIMHRNHLSPDEAVKVHKILESQNSLAVHFGTFRLSNESHGDPKEDLMIALKNDMIPLDKFRVLAPGESWIVPLARNKKSAVNH